MTNNSSRPLSKLGIEKIDVFFYVIVMLYLFLSTVHQDFLIGTSQVKAFLSGHILDFYDYFDGTDKSRSAGYPPNYFPSLYFAQGIWGILPNALGLTTDQVIATPVILWFKLGLVLCGYFAIVKFNKISVNLGYSSNKYYFALLATSPFFIYSLFIFSQYDILPLLFIVYGLYFFSINDLYKASLFFGISITFKYFGAIAFIPFLLVYEKSIPKLILNFFIFIAPYGIERMIYSNSPGFHASVLNYPIANTKLFYPSIGTIGSDKIHLFIFGYVVICAFAYFREKGNLHDNFRYGNFFSFAAISSVFMLIDWHPQWTIYISPFLILAALSHSRLKTILIYELFLYYFFLSYITHFFKHNTDVLMYANGIFAFMGNWEYSGRLMHIFYPPYSITWSFTAFSALLLSIVLLTHPRYSSDSGQLNARDKFDIWGLRIRFCISSLLFSIPAALCLKHPNVYLHLIFLLSMPITYLYLWVTRSRSFRFLR
jgi:hypothetical protein